MKIDIPKSLYKNNIVYFPDIIKQIYIDLLNEYNLYEKALIFKQGNDLIGGITKEATLDHFSQRFLTSGSRTGYLTINPHDNFKEIQKNIFESLLYGNVNILDIPCGTGGSTFNLFCTIGEIIEKNYFPSFPITINIYAADFSETALEIYDKFITRIKPHLKSIGIKINHYLINWDAFCSIQTNELIDKFLIDKFDECIIMINNFSGALKIVNNNKFNEILENCILSRLAKYRFLFIWIEPNYDDSDSIFSKFFKRCSIIIKQLFNIIENKKISSKYSWFNFIHNKIIDRGSINLITYKRN
ncbi:hypothetical protein KAZ01_00810 [Candidatus Gracilibacteria bacterium]|nr:hypothetical protein [Candidatus Gracilibacteria bacterium]